jgi:hypothetical protein
VRPFFRRDRGLTAPAFHATVRGGGLSLGTFRERQPEKEIRAEYLGPDKRLGITIIAGWTKANPLEAVLAIATLLIAPVLVIWSINLSGVFDGPSLYMLYISPPSAAYASDTYADVWVAVNNGGNTAAEGCSIRAYNHYLFSSSSDPDESSVLGESEQFTLPPQGGRSVTLSIYLPYISGEALFGGGIRSMIFFRTVCVNSESDASSQTVLLSPTSSSVLETSDYNQTQPFPPAR